MNYQNNEKNKTIITLILFLITIFVGTSVLILTSKYMLNKIVNNTQDSTNLKIHIKSDEYTFQRLNSVEPIFFEKNISDEITEDKKIPENTAGEFKSYMDYRKITNKNTKQYKLQQTATTDKHGFRRYGDLYMVALGTYFSPVSGLEFEIEFCNGKVINCITGDIKNDKHTDPSNSYNEINGSILEFIVDVQKIDELSRIMGDMSYSDMEGKIVRITQITEERENNEYR